MLGIAYLESIRKVDIHTVEVYRKKIGGKWKPVILFILKDKPARFNKIKQLMTGVSGNMLSLSLRQLQKDSLVCKKEGRRYGLTDIANKIADLLIQIKKLIESI